MATAVGRIEREWSNKNKIYYSSVEESVFRVVFKLLKILPDF